MPFMDLAAQRRRIGARMDQAIARVLEHGRFVLGPEVEQLERKLEAFTGARHCITCANGTDALILALLARSIGPGDAVLVPAFTFVATAEAVARVGATPVMVDVEADSFNIDASRLLRAVTVARAKQLRPRAVIAVDLFGQPADYDALRQFAADNEMTLIADAAQSFGASRGGRKVGTLAEITTTSFYPSKPLGCYGDGGAIFTEDDELAERLRSLGCHGQTGTGRDHGLVGMNSRLDSIQAAVLIEKLEVFQPEIHARNAIANAYSSALEGVVRCPRIADEVTSVWAQYTVVVDDGRDTLVRDCNAAGVPTAIHYAKPLHALSAYRDFPRASDELPVAAWLSCHVVSLPMHADLSEADQSRVTEAVVAAVRRAKRRKKDALDPQPALPD